MDGITAVLDISTLIYNGAAAENRNTTYIAKGGKLSHSTAALKVMSGNTYSTAPTSYFYIDDYIDRSDPERRYVPVHHSAQRHCQGC